MKRTLSITIAVSALMAGCVYQQPGTYPGAATPQYGVTTPQAPGMAQAAAVAAQSLGLPQIDTAAAKRLLSPDETLQTLDFPETGTKTLSGRVEGYKTVVYAMPVRKGQRLEVTMDTKSTAAYFNIKDARDTSGAALFAGEMAGANTALLRATEDATYVLQPYLVRAAARRGESADYTFKIERQ